MTSRQYIDQLTHAMRTTRGKDIPQKSCAGVIDGLCDVIADRDKVIADRDKVIADKDTVIASKDDVIARLNQEVMWLRRKIFGRGSEKFHAVDPSQLSLDFGEEVVLPLSAEQLDEESKRVEETKDSVHKEAEERQRQEKAVPIPGFIKFLPEKYRTVDTPASALASACNYALERWDGQCRYCDEGYYDIDNNIVERSIRSVTLGRKNWLFVDSNESAKDAAVYMTLIASCNLSGIAPYRYLDYILPKLHEGMTAADYAQLLPYKVAKVLK